MISEKEKSILREVAKYQLEVANSPKNQERVVLWKRHNALKGEQPLIHIEIDHFAGEVIEPKLECTHPVARRLEHQLYHRCFNLTELDDDKVVPDYFAILWDWWFKPFQLDIQKVSASGGGVGHQFQHLIEDLGEAYPTLKPSTFGIHTESTKAYFDAAQDVFGDILPVRMTMKSLWCVLTQDLVHIMGMENFLISLYEYPDELIGMLDRLSNDYIRYYHWLEENGYLIPTTSYEELNQGSLSFTDELHSRGPVTVSQVWGYMDSQESVGISPDMFGEMIFPYYKKVGDLFGLLSYGCCEPVDPVWQYLSQYKNLRKISISPWANEEIMGEQLACSSIIYQRKPSPNFLGVGPGFDEEGWRQHIVKTLTCAKNCKLEFTCRDVYTIRGDLAMVKRAVEIIREEITNRWTP